MMSIDSIGVPDFNHRRDQGKVAASNITTIALMMVPARPPDDPVSLFSRSRRVRNGFSLNTMFGSGNILISLLGVLAYLY